MGLSTTESGKFNIFSFFSGFTNDTLISKYNSSLGFYVNPVGDISESIMTNTFSSGLEDDANAASSQFQRLNYITGMGTAGRARNINRQVGIAGMQIGNLINVVKTNLSTGSDGSGGSNSILSFAGAANLVKSVVNFANTQDISAVVQQFQVTNGMRVQYPQL